MSDVIKGAASALVGTRRRYIPSVGLTTSFVYQFAKQVDAQAFFAGVVASGFQADIDDRGPVWTVEYSNPTAADGSSEVPIDLWEMPPINQDISIFQLNTFAALTEDDQLKLRHYDQVLETSSPAISGAANAVSFYNLLRRGTDHKQAPTVSLRWTRTVSNSWNSLGATYANVGRIFTAASILSLSPPSLISAAVSASTNILASNHPPATNFASGWLKQQSTITQRGLNKFDIVQEWVLENWSTFLYGSAI